MHRLLPAHLRPLRDQSPAEPVSALCSDARAVILTSHTDPADLDELRGRLAALPDHAAQIVLLSPRGVGEQEVTALEERMGVLAEEDSALGALARAGRVLVWPALTRELRAMCNFELLGHKGYPTFDALLAKVCSLLDLPEESTYPDPARRPAARRGARLPQRRGLRALLRR